MNVLFLVFVLTFLSSCVPFNMYQNLERKLSAQMAERNEMTKKLAVCEERAKNLKDTLKLRPAKTPAPVIEKINQAELDEIKKKALAITEQKFKARIEKGKTDH